MLFSVLGPVEATGDEGSVRVSGAKERALLARLLIGLGTSVSAGELIDTLWGDDPPPSAAKSLQTYVLRLRNNLEPGRNGTPSVVVTEGVGYRLAIPPESVDGGASPGSSGSAGRPFPPTSRQPRRPPFAGRSRCGGGRRTRASTPRWSGQRRAASRSSGWQPWRTG